jgi:hypothetical protein
MPIEKFHLLLAFVHHLSSHQNISRDRHVVFIHFRKMLKLMRPITNTNDFHVEIERIQGIIIIIIIKRPSKWIESN